MIRRVLLPFLVLSVASASAAEYRVTVAPVDHARAAELIAITLPADAPKSAALRTAAGRVVPLQSTATAADTATFLIDSRSAGEAFSATLVPAPRADPTATPDGDGVHVVPDGDRLRVMVGDQPALFFQTTPAALPDGVKPAFARGGFLHPVFTPAGRLVTDSYPRDHRHHHGIWTAWTKTEFQGRTPDFWNMGGPQGGTVEFVGLDQTWSGPVHGGFAARLRVIDRTAPTPTVALDERWRVTAYRTPTLGAHVFDLELTQTCAGADSLKLLAYRYGGLGFRGHAQWLDKANLHVLTSEGETDRLRADTQRVRWCYLGGDVDGARTGVAILSHPDNFRAPQPIRMNPDQPFLCFAPVQAGEFAITPTEPYTARYRFIVFDGPADATRLEACWQAFAHPSTGYVKTAKP